MKLENQLIRVDFYALNIDFLETSVSGSNPVSRILKGVSQPNFGTQLLQHNDSRRNIVNLSPKYTYQCGSGRGGFTSGVMVDLCHSDDLCHRRRCIVSFFLILEHLN